MAELAVADSHGLLWYALGRKRKLGSEARRLFERADRGRGVVYVPTIALVEISEARHRGVVRIQGGLGPWGSKLFSSPHFIPVDLSLAILLKAEELYVIPERGDRLVAATAAVLGLPLMTSDPEIAKAANVEVVW
jgi:PIN domain nuclease of toxin-antitoxin system